MKVNTVSYYVTDMFTGQTKIGKIRVTEDQSDSEKAAVNKVVNILYKGFQDKSSYPRYNIRYNDSEGWVEAKYLDAKGGKHHGRYDNFLVVRSL